MIINATDETNQAAPARKKTKLNEELPHLLMKKSCRIKELTSLLVELSKEYQELNDLNEFDKLMNVLNAKQNEHYLDKSYGFVAPVSKRFQQTYDKIFNGNKETAPDFRGLSKEAGVYIIESFPENSALTMDRDDLYSLFTEKDPEAIDGTLEWDLCAKDYLIHKAACQGNLQVFRHIVENGNILRAQDKNFFLYQQIAENGHLHILKYLKDDFFFFHGFCCSSFGAARGGHVHILKWLKELGCFKPENKHVIRKCAKIAAEYGHLEVLQYMKENIDPLQDFQLIHDALKSKSLDVVKFCHAQRSNDFARFRERQMRDVIGTGKVEIVRFFSDNRGTLSERSTDFAHYCGHLDILKYLVSKGITWNVNWTIGSKTFEFIKFAYETYREWFGVTIRDCIDSEHLDFNLDMLKYLRQHGCSFGLSVSSSLISLKQTAFLEYFKEDWKYVEGIPDRELILIHAISEKWFEGIRYILENNMQCNVPFLSLVAFEFPRLDVLEYCKNKGLQWETQDVEMSCTRVLRKVAQESTDVDTYKWIFNEMRAEQFHFDINFIAPNRTDLHAFLLEKKCVYDPRNILHAVTEGNLNYLESLLMHYHDPLQIEESVFDEALRRFEFEKLDGKDIVSLLVKSDEYQSKWGAVSDAESHVIIVPLSTLPPSTDAIETPLSQASIKTMASGELPTELKFFLYAQDASSDGSIIMVQASIGKSTPCEMLLTIKISGHGGFEKVEAFVNVLKNALGAYAS